MPRALIVDDKPDNLYLLRGVLEGHGWEVEDARHGAEALARARRHPPEVVISDLLMPVMDGYTLLSRWKADERLRSIPFVVCTATYTDQKDEQLALDLGADAFEVKPIEPEPFMARLREAIERARKGSTAKGAEADGSIVLKEYNEVLIHKLVAKTAELERLNRELAQRHGMLRAILDSEPECVKVVASDGSLLEMNPAGLRMIEADSLQQAVGRSLLSLVVEHHRMAFRDLTERVFRGESGTLEFEVVGLKGGRRWLETHATPLRNENGAIAALLGITRDVTERHNAATALRESESRMLTTFGLCPLPIAINRWTDGTIVEANPAFLDLVGSTRDEVVGRTPDQLGFLTADPARLRRTFEAQETMSNVEVALTTAHGPTRRLLMGSAFATLQNEKHAIATFVDITDRAAADDMRRQNEQRYLRQRDALIELTSDRGDGRGRGSVVEAITERAARTMGVARVSIWRYAEDRAFLRCIDRYDVDTDRHSSGMELARADYPVYFAAIEKLEVLAADDVAADPRTCEFGDSYLRPLGTTAMLDAPVHVGGAIDGVVCHEHTGAPRQWTEDEQVFALAIANVTALTLEESVRRRAENELRKAQFRLERAVSAGNVGLWDWDLATNQVYYSLEWKRQLGYEEHELSNAFDEWQTRLHPDDRDRTLGAVRAYLARPGPDFETESRIRHKDGSYRHILSRASLLRDDAGVPTHMLGSHVDITRYAELHAQFLQSQKMDVVGQLAGGVAHDFNNLLTVINGTVDLLLTDLRAGDPTRTDLMQIRDAGDRAASLTRQLLAFSRKQILKPGVLDLNALVGDMQVMLQRLLGETIELVFTPATTIGAVRADPGQIEQVVMNLIVNARDAMPDGGTVTIETEDVEIDAEYAADHPSVPPGPYVMLAVSDVGVGMDEATRLRIFEPFFTTKGPARGTGLGLSTVYGIVKQTGGNIWVYSEPGGGTTFKMYLPRVDAAVPAVRPGRAAIATRGTGTILVVEDEVAVRSLASRILTAAGYTVLTAGSAAHALSMLERHGGPVHLMLTDLVMPGMSGRELADHLSGIRPGMKVLYTSGYTDDTILRRGVLEDSAQFISKPYTVTELTRKVRELLDARGRGAAGDGN